MVSADCLATLLLIGIYLLVDIAKIECRHAQIRRLLLAGNVGRNRHISWASAMWLLGICRRLALVSAFRAERKRPRGRTNKTPKKNRVRKAPKQRQRPHRGAGLRRALLSAFLASPEGRALNKKGNRKEALKAAHQHAIAVQQQGGSPLEEAAHRGRCVQVARSHGGFAFRLRQRRASQPSPVALAWDASLECTLGITRRESLACGREVAAVEHRRRERLQSWATALRSCLPFPRCHPGERRDPRAIGA